MRHRVLKHNFGRSPAHRKALLRGLVASLVTHGRVRTTLAKARELRRRVERAVSLAKKQTLAARRLLLKRYPNKVAVRRLMDDVAGRFSDRSGGYTRVLKLGPRAGDRAPMALVEFIDFDVAELKRQQQERYRKAQERKQREKKADEPLAAGMNPNTPGALTTTPPIKE